MKQRLWIALGLFWVLGVAAWGVWTNERILSGGQTVLLELAPVDPRSLMQGDYMALNYALNASIVQKQSRDDGYAVVSLDARRVAKLVRTQADLSSETLALKPDELVIRYRVRNHRVQIASNAFFFQEGHEPLFRNARFGEFRVGSNGEPRLVAMLDADLKKLGENRF